MFGGCNVNRLIPRDLNVHSVFSLHKISLTTFIENMTHPSVIKYPPTYVNF